MKYSKLKHIVKERANTLKESAAYSGAWNDGGSGDLLDRLSCFKKKLIIKLDLRPSEYYKLNDIEVGEPKEFLDIIYKFKQKIAKDIQL